MYCQKKEKGKNNKNKKGKKTYWSGGGPPRQRPSPRLPAGTAPPLCLPAEEEIKGKGQGERGK